VSRLGQPFRIVWALLFFTYELLLANLRVARDVAIPGRLPRQIGIYRVDTDARTDWEYWVIANAISLTPGTLTLEVDAEHQRLYVHTLYAEGRAAFAARMASFERVLLGAMR
jgi:multicomponent Na+:H+ antiporter subunit E